MNANKRQQNADDLSSFFLIPSLQGYTVEKQIDFQCLYFQSLFPLLTNCRKEDLPFVVNRFHFGFKKTLVIEIPLQIIT